MNSIYDRLPIPGTTVRINGRDYVVVSAEREHGNAKNLAAIDSGYLHSWSEFIDLYSEEGFKQFEVTDLVGNARRWEYCRDELAEVVESMETRRADGTVLVNHAFCFVDPRWRGVTINEVIDRCIQEKK